MTPIVVLSGALIAMGVFVIVLGLQRRIPAHHPRTGAARGRGAGRPRSFWVKLATAVVGGVGVQLLTGWIIAVLLVPLAVFGLPWLLGAPPNREIEVVRALDRWTRSLASAMPTGKSVADAIRATRRQVPPVLATPVGTLVQRLDARWSAPDALRAMADELASPDADACLSALALAAARGGVGTTATLHSLSDSLQHRLRALREIEAERAKPRLVVQQITVITMVVIAAALLFGGDFFAPYSTPLGQVILSLLLGIYVLSLVVLRRKTLPRTRERILVGLGGSA